MWRADVDDFANLRPEFLPIDHQGCANHQSAHTMPNKVNWFVPLLVRLNYPISQKSGRGSK